MSEGNSSLVLDCVRLQLWLRPVQVEEAEGGHEAPFIMSPGVFYESEPPPKSPQTRIPIPVRGAETGPGAFRRDMEQK